MYGGWYGVCNFFVLSVVEICVDYGSVNVFHVCFDFCVWVLFCGVVCVVLYFCLICDACS